jgi:hypothetical protein
MGKPGKGALKRREEIVSCLQKDLIGKIPFQNPSFCDAHVLSLFSLDWSASDVIWRCSPGQNLFRSHLCDHFLAV